MNGYDFDKTIYAKDSSTQFFLYMIFTRPYLLVFLAWYLVVLCLYGLKILSKKKTKECLFFFIPWYKHIDKIVDKFWSKNANLIYDYYSKQRKSDDVIISASLDFIIKPVMEMLGVQNYIATKYDLKTGKILGENCYGEVKLKKFEEQFSSADLDEFYSDSMSDLPMMKRAKQAFLIKKGKINKVEV